MYNELTSTDIAKMQKELDYRRIEEYPVVLEEVKRTRAFGDLSENAEYKAAKQAQNACRKRIRYLERMIKSATVIDDTSAPDEVGLFDLVELYFEDDEECQTIQVVTTVRCDPREGRISKESPMGKILLGKHVGDRFQVQATPTYSYWCSVRAITKEEDDGSAPIL